LTSQSEELKKNSNDIKETLAEYKAINQDANEESKSAKALESAQEAFS